MAEGGGIHRGQSVVVALPLIYGARLTAPAAQTARERTTAIKRIAKEM